ncbi:MAG TPA: hypothetical protein VGK59_08025 [Ohtaekwangia sp.]
MNRIVLLVMLVISCFYVQAQDEGEITKRERIALSKGVFISGGPSFTLGDNIGDYSMGYNVSIGFLKRTNRILSVGSSFSYNSFIYDPEKTTDDYNNIYTGDVGDYYEGYIMDLEGGNLQLFSLSFDLKVNFVPVRDNSVFSFYAFAKPFVTMAMLGKITGDVHEYHNYGEEWEFVETHDARVETDSEITGGIFIGPGVELNPAKKISISLQAAFGYTFPVTFISTDSYKENDLETFFDDDFPLTKKGFPSVNVSLGLTYNF